MALTDEEKKDIYKRWHDLINMSDTALKSWAEDDDRLLASINRQEAKDSGNIQSGYDSFHRIKRRKTKPFKDWSDDDFVNAKQEIGFNSRMLGGKPGDPVGDSKMSKWEISLRNWGHDPSLKSSPQYSKWKSWNSKHFGKKASSMTTPRNIAETYLLEQTIKRAIKASQKVDGYDEAARIYGHLLRKGSRVASSSLSDVSMHFTNEVEANPSLREKLGLTYLQEIINHTAESISSKAKSSIRAISTFLEQQGLAGKMDYLINSTFKPRTGYELLLAKKLKQAGGASQTLAFMGTLLSASTPKDFAGMLGITFAEMRDLFGVSEGEGDSWFIKKWESFSNYLVELEDAKLLVVKVGFTIVKLSILSLLFGTPLAAIGHHALQIVVGLVVLVLLTNKKTTANIIRKMGISLAVFSTSLLLDLTKFFKYLVSIGGDLLSSVRNLFKRAAVREIHHFVKTDPHFREAFRNA